KLTLGRAGADGLTLAAARAAAAAHRHRLETHPGVTPVTAVTGQSSAAAGDKIETAVAAFLELHVRRKNRASTARTVECIFSSIVLPAWRGRTIGSIRRRDVIELVESVAASGRGYRANKRAQPSASFSPGWSGVMRLHSHPPPESNARTRKRSGL